MSTRKRTYSSRTGPASYKRAKTLSAKAIQQASTIAAPRRSRIEVKRAYSELATTSVTGNGQIEALARIASGPESDEREGRAVQIKGWEVRGIVSSNTGTGGSLVRIIVFKWKQALVTPVVGQILYNNGSGQTITRSYNIDEAANYDILQDRLYNLGARTLNVGGSAYDPWQEHVHLYGKSNFVQTYAGIGVTDVADCQLYVLAVSEHPSSPINLSTSVTFIDI